MFRAMEFILVQVASDTCLPACDSKPQGLLRLISDEVPHRYIALILVSEPGNIINENGDLPGLMNDPDEAFNPTFHPHSR